MERVRMMEIGQVWNLGVSPAGGLRKRQVFWHSVFVVIRWSRPHKYMIIVPLVAGWSGVLP